VQQCQQCDGSALRQVAMTHNGTKRCLTHGPTSRGVAQQSVHPLRQLGNVLHHRKAAAVAQHRDMVGEVAGVWPDGNCTAKARWFERVLPAAWRQQAAAHECKPAQPVQQPEFAQSVGDPNPFRRWPITTRTIAFGLDIGAAFRMARGDDGQQARVVVDEHPVHLADQRLFAWMSAGGEPNRTRPEQAAQPAQLRLVRRQGYCGKL